MTEIKIAAFGFRHIPPCDGSAGADKFAVELYSRLIKLGCNVTVYNRIYNENNLKHSTYQGIKIVNLRTVKRSGFDSLLHSLKATFHIILFNTGKIVHIHNGGNGIFAIILRIFGKKIFISQDGIDWKRGKWKWYAKIYLYLTSFITAYFANKVIFDNVFAKELFEKRFCKKFDFIPYGSEVKIEKDDKPVLKKYNLNKGEYFLFVGRFIPDKGLQYLIPAFEKVQTNKKLILVGGSPNTSMFESNLRKTEDKRIIFTGYIYGDDTNILIKNCYTYIQPSDVEGLSPVVLTVLGLGVPVLCSDIPENLYLVKDEATIFKKSSIESLIDKINYVLENPEIINQLALKAQKRILKDYSWDNIAEQHFKLFNSFN